MIVVPNYDTLINLPSKPKDGELAVVESEKKFYAYTDGKWIVNEENEQQITLFDLNQNLIHQMPEMPEEEVKAGIAAMANFCRTHDNRFYALLCRDINYYTLFEIAETGETFIEDDLFSVFDYLGSVKAINSQEMEGAYEIWIETRDGCNVFMFFPYDLGVITCHL